MKLLVSPLLLAMLWLGGCATRQPPVFDPASDSAGKTSSSAKKEKGDNQLIVTPDAMLSGRVVVYNEAGRFVVLDFPIGHLPANDLTMFVFRNGLKVGEVKVTGPQRDHNTVADLVTGEARKGDEVRDR